MEEFFCKTRLICGSGSVSALGGLGGKRLFLVTDPFFAKNGDIMTIVSGVLIVLIVMFYAGGLAQLVGQIRAKARLKKAERRLANGG